MDRVVVVKVGGSLGAASAAALGSAVIAAPSRGRPLLVVHGGGPRISAALAARGLDLPFVDGQRITTEEAMPVVEQVLVDEVNRELSATLTAAGVRALGLGRRYRPLTGAGLTERTGRVVGVDVPLLTELLATGQTPVLAPVAYGAAGEAYNVNADLAAASVATALKAERIVFLTDVPGIYTEYPTGHRLKDVPVSTLADMRQRGSLAGGMIPKVDAVLAALQGGVETAFVVQGNQSDSVRRCLFSDPVEAFADDAGTRIRRSEEEMVWKTTQLRI